MTQSVSEVFDTAMAMEQTSKDFYETLAVACDTPQVQQFCRAVALQEAGHFAVFAKLRRQWQRSPQGDPDAYSRLSLLARKQIIPDPASVHRAAVGGRLPDALAMAMQMERDAIRFYADLAAHLPAAAEAIRSIIQEEKRHLAQLHTLGA